MLWKKLTRYYTENYGSSIYDGKRNMVGYQKL